MANRGNIKLIRPVIAITFMLKEKKPIEVILEYHPAPDSEQHLQAAYDMLFINRVIGLQLDDQVDSE